MLNRFGLGACVLRKLNLLLIAMSLSGCASQAAMELPADMLRPVVVMRYELPLQSATNNAPALRDAISLSSVQTLSPDERQIVIVSNITDSSQAAQDVAMARAMAGAKLAMDLGEIEPRIYVRQSSSKWQKDSLEIYAVPKKLWGDSAYKSIVMSESISVTALGGVLKAEVARLGLDQVMEHSLSIDDGQLVVELGRVLRSVGWNLNSYRVPGTARVRSATIGVVLSNRGLASSNEAMEISRAIIQVSSEPGLTIKSDNRRKVIEVYGE